MARLWNRVAKTLFIWDWQCINGRLSRYLRKKDAQELGPYRCCAKPMPSSLVCKSRLCKLCLPSATFTFGLPTNQNEALNIKIVNDWHSNLLSLSLQSAYIVLNSLSWTISRMPAVVDKNRGPESLAIFCTGTAIAAIAVVLRLWVRNKIVRKVGLDDWIVAASLVNPHLPNLK